MMRFIIFASLAGSAFGSPSEPQCLTGSGTSCRGGDEDSDVLLQGRLRVADDSGKAEARPIPSNGKCEKWNCQGADLVPKANIHPEASCTSVLTCDYNCCEVDIKSDRNYRIETLSFAAVQAMKNLTEVGHGLSTLEAHTIDQDHAVVALKDGAAGLTNLMELLYSGGSANPCDGEVTSIRNCVHKALCHIQKDTVTQEETERYAMLMEYYARFEDITWDMMGITEEGMTLSGPSNKAIEPVSYDELSCDDITGSMKDMQPRGAMLEVDASDTSAKAQAHRVSAALADAAKTTHLLLDAHMQNSSVDDTVAALYQAWEGPCKLMDCDHTNYFDLFGASHTHSLTLLQVGASAQHMQVHIRTRLRLENRMQHFLGSHGEQFASRIYKVEGTTTDAQFQRYGNKLSGAVRRGLKELPKKYGLDPRVIGLVNRQELKNHAKTAERERTLEAVWDSKLLLVDDSQDADDEEMQPKEDDDADDDDEAERMQRQEEAKQVSQSSGLSEGSLIEEATTKSLERTLNKKFWSGVGNLAKDLGKKALKSSYAYKAAKYALDNKDEALEYAQDPERAHNDLLARADEERNKRVPEYAKIENQPEYFKQGVRGVAGGNIETFYDWVESLFSCFGETGSAGSIGFAKKMPADCMFDDSCSPKKMVKRGIAILIAMSVKLDLEKLIKEMKITKPVALTVSVMYGLVPGNGKIGGVRLGLGAAAGITCGDPSKAVFNCKVKISVGTVTSAIAPIKKQPQCLFQDKLVYTVSPRRTIGCAIAYGVTFKIMCCKIDFATSEETCTGTNGALMPPGVSKPADADEGRSAADVAKTNKILEDFVNSGGKTCPWISGTTGTPDFVLCKNGQSVRGSCMSRGHGQVQKCPPNKPHMCQNKGSDGDHICAENNCDGTGGDRTCTAADYVQLDSCDETLFGNGASYRGCQATTRGGRRCQKWTSQVPHTHDRLGYDLFKADKMCYGNKWLSTYNVNPAVCIAAILARGDCSKEFFNHATEGDGACGCVDRGATCTNPPDHARVSLYRIKATCFTHVCSNGLTKKFGIDALTEASDDTCCEAQIGCFNVNVILTSHRNQQLEDRDGTVGVHADSGAYQKWSISRAGGNQVFLTSHRNQQLEDRHGTVGVRADKGGYQKWSISHAGGNKVFLTSHRNQQLEDRVGTVGVRADKGNYQKWTITNANSGEVCSSAALETGLTLSYDCNKQGIDLGDVYDFTRPFSLSLDVTTASTQQGNGGIFAARSSNARVELHWTGSGFLFQLCQTGTWSACIVKGDREPASKDQSYAVQIEWDGTTARWAINGVVKGQWQTSLGFGSKKPNVCYSGSGGVGGWQGSIRNLKLQSNNQAFKIFQLDILRLLYPAVTCPAGYYPVDAADCRTLGSYSWQRELHGDHHWIGGCFEWYTEGAGPTANTRKVFYNNRAGAVTGNIGGNRLCKKARATCTVGQTQSGGPYLFWTNDNSRTACENTCSAHSGCVGFDYTTISRGDSCRGVGQGQTPLSSAGAHNRQYCAMQALKTIATGKRCNPWRWLNYYKSDPLFCAEKIKSRSDCSQQYFFHASSDGNCGCVPNTATDCSQSGNQANQVHVTIYAMQAVSTVQESNNALGDGDNNFCRNPSGKSSSIWCFTTDANMRWEYCDRHQAPSGGVTTLYTQHNTNQYHLSICNTGDSASTTDPVTTGTSWQSLTSPSRRCRSDIQWDVQSDGSYSISTFIPDAGYGLYGRRYLSLGSNYGKDVKSRFNVAGWCEKFYLEKHEGGFGFYTKNNNNKYYLKICNDGKAVAQTSVAGWCEKFIMPEGEPVEHGQPVNIKNLFDNLNGTGTYLDTCGNTDTRTECGHDRDQCGSCGHGAGVSTTRQGASRMGGRSGTWRIFKKSGEGILNHGDEVHIRSVGGSAEQSVNIGSFMHVCGSPAKKCVGSNQESKYEVSTTSKSSRLASHGTWRIEKETGSGPLFFGEPFHLKNTHSPGTYLDTCGGTDCNNGGYEVSTNTNKKRDGKSGTWMMEKAVPYFTGGDPGTNDCPPGYTNVLTHELCRTAAGYLSTSGLPPVVSMMGGHTSQNSRPKGCFYSMGGDKFFYNPTKKVPTSPSTGTKPICKQGIHTYLKIADGKQCTKLKWLGVKDPNPSVCAELVATDPECSKTYFNHASGQSGADNNCGCVVGRDKDCSTSESQSTAAAVDIYEIQVSFQQAG